MGTRILLFISIICIFLCTSCTSTKKIAYFENTQDTSFRQVLGVIDAPFQKNDILEIVISSRSKEASADFNKPDLSSKGYLINNAGDIDLPMIGVIKAAGLTKKQLKENITNAILLKKLLVEPMVEIRHLNFEVTILGEVGHPTVINVPSEQISLIKALALAGDLTIYGKRENVLLVREEDGQRKTRRIDLNSSDFLNSPYYYLKPNDMVYVEPNKTRLFATGKAQQILPLALTGVSLLFLVLDKVIK